MTHPSDKPDETAPNEPAAEAEVAPPAGEPAAAATNMLDPGKELETVRAENADLKDRLLRAHAEMDNVRKRLEREKADAQKYAISKFARDVVTVGDNFQRAITAVPAHAVEQTPALKSFLEGVTMTERELVNALERHGIKRIDPMGEAFNPHMHQAVMEAESAEVPAGTVVQVFQPGYTIEDRVLRPAMVVVAKGGAKSARPAESPPQAANDDHIEPGPEAPGDGSGTRST